jgi:glutamate--cysteine ligase
MAFASIKQRLAKLERLLEPHILRQSYIGLEKESLRVAKSGGIAMTPHPAAWGASLTHPYLTTDYSEALAEFITPPLHDVGQALDFLADMQTYAYRQLDQEILWATSMPCVLNGDAGIPIAQYGNSNLGRMKHIYRVGLGHRYGRVMQVIAGVHFNWSLDEAFWPVYQTVLQAGDTPANLRDRTYLGLVRNIARVGWLVPYLFGASPTVCRSFFADGKSNLDLLDEHTYYEPYATSLRMGDIGYQNSKEEGLGFHVCYDSVEAYADSLLDAITRPADAWQRIGVKVNGEYRQLNANILQIENEYYSSIRPKQILQGLESPAIALKQRGIQYIELRSLDVNAYHPLGVDETQLRFLEALMLTCMLVDSPPLSGQEQTETNQNLLAVAHRGREPGLMLSNDGKMQGLYAWGGQVLQAMMPVCAWLDAVHQTHIYEDALDDQLNKLAHPELTPSARMLHEMRERGEGFFDFAQRLSMQHYRFFNARDLPTGRCAEFDQLAQQSLQKQAGIEAEPQQDFDKFLADYFSTISTYKSASPSR